MELLTFTGTNGAQHWLNPTKVVRITFTPSSTEEGNVIPPSIVIHMDGGFSIKVADDVEDIVDKINKEI